MTAARRVSLVEDWAEETVRLVRRLTAERDEAREEALQLREQLCGAKLPAQLPWGLTRGQGVLVREIARCGPILGECLERRLDAELGRVDDRRSTKPLATVHVLIVGARKKLPPEYAIPKHSGPYPAFYTITNPAGVLAAFERARHESV
jgi:hypothetical protein